MSLAELFIMYLSRSSHSPRAEHVVGKAGKVAVGQQLTLPRSEISPHALCGSPGAERRDGESYRQTMTAAFNNILICLYQGLHPS